MNKSRRKELDAIIKRVEAFKVALDELDVDELDSINASLSDIKEAEDEYKNNMPEALQGGEKGQQAEQAVSEMEAAMEVLETLRDALQDFNAEAVVESLSNAKGEG